MGIKRRDLGDFSIPFDIRHRSIIDAFPFHTNAGTVLDVGTGVAPVSRELKDMGWNVDALDLESHDSWECDEGINFIESDFLTCESLKDEYSVVMCSEVLEHLPNYKEFYKKMLSLAKHRVIMTVPFEFSFMEFGPPPKGHCNFWSWQSFEVVDQYTEEVKYSVPHINEFIDLAHPYSVSISAIRTKAEDLETNQACFLIVADKSQLHCKATVSM